MPRRAATIAKADTTPPRRKKVGILGFAETWKEAPFDDPDWEFWGLNELWKYVKRWDRWFEIHDGETLGITKRDLSEGEQKRHIEWLSRDHGARPIYMLPHHCEGGRFPNAVAYPLDAMVNTFGRYFTSTIGYMIALAIAEDFTTIGLFGIDLASDVEYPNQRPNAEYLIGIARGQGREVIVPDQAAILHAGFLYGYERPHKEAGGVLSAVEKHKATLVQKHEETLATLHTIDGAIQESENFIKLLRYKDRGVHVEKY